jgi:hypothetical protein
MAPLRPICHNEWREQLSTSTATKVSGAASLALFGFDGTGVAQMAAESAPRLFESLKGDAEQRRRASSGANGIRWDDVPADEKKRRERQC